MSTQAAMTDPSAADDPERQGGEEPPSMEEPEQAGDQSPDNDPANKDIVDEGVALDSSKSEGSQQVRSAKLKDFVFSFENLTVNVPGGGNGCCACLDNPINNCAQEYMGLSVQQRDPFCALNNASGFLRSGEMCLVLGSNDISKSTLLRALCGRLNEQDELSGTIMLNGMPLGKSNQGWRRLSPYVSANDATHSPVLTVKETFTFAAQCTSDGHRSSQEIDDEVEKLMDALGLAHVADTVVGDENIRGVSGGQKRRVTVGEMMTDPGASFLCLENITDGLASSDSLSLITKLSDACSVSGMAGFVSLLQPSDEMVEQFQKLMVLTGSGEMTYFGPMDRAVLRDIFLGKDADPSEDSGSIADLVLSQTLQQSDSEDENKEDAALQRFVASGTHEELTESLAQIRASAASAGERNVDELLPDKKYSTSRWYQFEVLGARRLKLISRNAVTYTRAVIAIVFGIIIGSLFSVLNNDMMGSLGRTGYMFLNSFLVLMLSAAVTIPEAFRQRPTLFKQRSAEFYSGRVSYISQVLLDMPLSVLEATLLSTISYFWVGMNSGANHFFYFWGVLVGLECVGQAFARLLCALIRKQATANALSTVGILLCGTVAGFMPAYNEITWVLRWLSWVTPVAYSFEGMMINEFIGREIAGIVIGGDDGNTEIGNLTGSAWIGNFGLPRASWGSPTSIKMFDLGMLFVFALIYDFIGMYYVERTRGWYHNQTRRPESIVNSMEISKPVKSRAKSEQGDEGEADDDGTWPQSLSVRNLCYTVSVKGKTKCTMESLLGPCLVKMACKKTRAPSENLDENENELVLLNNVDARFRRGRMTALMGTSGAGKTTLLDVIAGYKTGGRITGETMIDGRLKDEKVWKKISGYAEQNDILNPYLSVLETLRFTASCRLPNDVDREAVIDSVVKLMGLEEWTHVVVGRELEGEGLPKHARKRVTIADQLVVQPKILFLDEPTTGLGTNEAALVIGAIRRATDELGLITLATIHQPSKYIWDTFDDLLLLVTGGQVAYMGEMGMKSELVLNYFASLSGSDPPPSCNPADYALSVLNNVSPDEAVATFGKCPQYEMLASQIESDTEQKSSAMDTMNLGRANSRLVEFFLLVKRQTIVQWRNPSYCFVRIMCSIFVSLYMGILFSGDKTQLSGAVFSVGAIFFLVFVLVIPMQASVVPLIEDRAVLYRESMSGAYSRLSYGLGQLVADIPFHMLNAFLMFICFYFLVDFRTEGGLAGYFLLMLFMANWAVMSLGQFFASAAPNEESANGLAGLSVMLSVILMGFLITVNAMPDGWVWAYWANMFRYILQGLVTNELAGNSYNVNLGNLGLNISGEIENVTEMILFEPGVDPASDPNALQGANLLNLVALAGEGINAQGGIQALSALVSCMVANECLLQPLATNFMQCTVLPSLLPPMPPPCKDEFNTVTETVDVGEVAKCFVPSFGNGTESSQAENAAEGVPSNVTIDEFEGLEDDASMDIVLCLVKILLPPEVVEGLDWITEIVDDLFGVLMVILDVVQNGLSLPGELILFFFGWAEFTEDGFEAPWKWHYCMTAVAAFLVGLQILKLFSVCFIVWTKR